MAVRRSRSDCTTNLPLIKVLTPEKSLSLPTAISDLLYRVQQLQKETDSLNCKCDQHNCPFINKSSLEDRLLSHPVLMKSNGPATNVLPRNLSVSMSVLIERRGDGTIVERDGPTRNSQEDSLEKRLMKTSTSTTSGQHLSVLMTPSRNDCEVDNDNLFGTFQDTSFTRIDPKRRHIRVTQKAYQRRRTLDMGSVSNCSHQLQTHINSTQSLSSLHAKLSRNTLHVRSVTSLPSCIIQDHCEDYERCSVSSDSSA